jgi:hypothetical protein
VRFGDAGFVLDLRLGDTDFVEVRFGDTGFTEAVGVRLGDTGFVYPVVV